MFCLSNNLKLLDESKEIRSISKFLIDFEKPWTYYVINLSCIGDEEK